MIYDLEPGEHMEPSENFDVLDDRDPRPGRRRDVKPWLSAVAGAAVASAVWTAAVFWGGPGAGKPDASAFRLGNGFCRSVGLTSLGTAIAPPATDAVIDSGVLRYPALDQIRCTIPLGGGREDEQAGPWFTVYGVDVTVAVHKKSDPGEEFEAQQRVTDAGVVPPDAVKPVPGLGDAAFVIVKDAGHSELRVLDGAAVLSLTLSVSHYYKGDDTYEGFDDEPALPEQSDFRPAMIKDMRALLATVRR
ncbi:hypothetical protein [Streptomyces sp. NPDC060184]|uniref:hypothetical protein n=1 Tax=Streptomyces sp. NPDC060184 TaxID=3347064 RepID=UPI00364F6D23